MHTTLSPLAVSSVYALSDECMPGHSNANYLSLAMGVSHTVSGFELSECETAPCLPPNIYTRTLPAA